MPHLALTSVPSGFLSWTKTRPMDSLSVYYSHALVNRMKSVGGM
jgi:hypothetical protein